ncbi:MAG: hypothetical protein ACREBS_04650 [Nitrososphaerales archaeon]
MKIGGGHYKRGFELHPSNATKKTSPLPKLTFSTRSGLSAGLIAQALSDISSVSNHVSVTATKNSVMFAGKGDSGSAKAILNMNSTLYYLLKIIKVVSSVEENLIFECSAKNAAEIGMLSERRQ